MGTGRARGHAGALTPQALAALGWPRATGSSIGMENVSCVTAVQCRDGRNCLTLPGTISSNWVLWMFLQNHLLCLQ